MTPPATPDERLHILLCSLFTSGEEFRRWVALGPDGRTLVAEFPSETVSTSAVIYGGLDVLRRRGCLNPELFERLAVLAPARRDEIVEVAVALRIPVGQVKEVRPRATIYALASDDALSQPLATSLRDGLAGWAVEVSALTSEALSAAPPPLKPASYLVYLCSPGATGLSRAWMTELARHEVVLVTSGVDALSGGEYPLHLRLAADNAADSVQSMLTFFRKELIERSRPVARADQRLLRGVSRRVLRLVARNCIDDAILDSFLFDAELERGRIKGNSLHERLIDLLHVADTEGLLAQFSDFLVDERERCVRAQLARMGEA